MGGMKPILCIALSAAAVSAAAVGDAPRPAFLQPTDVCSGIPSHPAVVNSVAIEEFGRGDRNLSLAGEWDFVAFRHGSGHRTCRYMNDLWAKGGRKINVPSCWEAEGVGEEGLSNPGLCQDNSRKKIRHSYVGEGWYRRYVDIPKSWEDGRIWIKIGGILAQGWVFVNDQAVCQFDSGVGSYKWEITGFVTPGERAKIVVNADNEVGHRGGPPASIERWGGIWRDIELESTGEAIIDDVWMRGDYDARCAEARVVVEGARRANGRLSVRLSVEGHSAEAEVGADGRAAVRVPLKEFRPWSPESPGLYWARVELLKDGRMVDVRNERFGVRKIEVRGREFRLNGRPFFVRGVGDNPQYPITGITPADRDFHRARLAKLKAAGFNYIRHHTHSECAEYMEACDELGLIVAPEIPYYLDNPNDYFSYDPLRDVETLVRTFRRHPSFGVLSFGNEGLLGPGANKVVYDFAKSLDPGILVLAQDGGTYLCNNGEGCSDFCSGPLTIWKRGDFNPPRPFVAHEYMNLAAKFDWRTERDFTGVWVPPMTEEDRVSHLAHTGLPLEWLVRLQESGHSLQALWQKIGVESARADPYCDGFIFWTIADSTVFNKKAGTYTSQGVFDPFWRPKRCGSTPESFARFNSATCILLDTEEVPRNQKPGNDPMLLCSGSSDISPATNRVFASGERIGVSFVLSHYGESPIVDGRIEWVFADDDGRVLASGTVALGDQPAGPAREVAKFDVEVPALQAPVKATLTATVVSDEADIRQVNSWPFWFVPKTSRPVAPEGVVVVRFGDEAAAEEARREGKGLVVMGPATGEPNYKMGWWNIGTQVGTASVRHPALGAFPYERFLAPLHFRMIREGVKLPVEGWDPSEFIMVGEGMKDAYLYIAAKERLEGGREVFVSGLDLDCGTVEANFLLGELFRWGAAGR